MANAQAALALALLWRVPDEAVAALVAALVALGLRSLARIAVDRGRPPLVTLGRALAGGLALVAGAALSSLALTTIAPSRSVVVAASLVFLVVLGTAALPGGRPAALVVMAPLVATVGLTVMATSLLLPAGLLRAPPAQSAVQVVLTGEGRRELVRWAPAGLPLREDGLRAHRVQLQGPDGRLVGEGWLYGAAMIVTAEAFCPAPGEDCLLRLGSLRNDGAPQAPGARLHPPQAVVIEARGPARVPGWWPPVQQRLLRGIGLGSREVFSGPLPLLDSQGLPLRAAYPLAVRDKHLAAP